MNDIYSDESIPPQLTRPTPWARLLIALVMFLLVVGAGVAFLSFELLQPTNSSQESVNFIIPKGQSVAVIAQRLEDQGLISHPLVFRIVARYKGIEQQIQAGTFELSSSQSVFEIADTLTQGTEDLWITLLEGWRDEEVAEYLASQDLPLFDESEFLNLAKTTPGRLFPDTYLIPHEMTSTQIHSLLVNTFETKVIEGLEAEIADNPRDFQDVLVMASLVEREAREYEQMRHVAGILWHRTNIGMALQVDATLQYTRGFDPAADSWWSPPRATDKTISSPYNTYASPGLPPTPISNPGLNAIKATLDPIDSNDLFYLHARSGEMYYAETLQEHNANIDRYLR